MSPVPPRIARAGLASPYPLPANAGMCGIPATVKGSSLAQDRSRPSGAFAHSIGGLRPIGPWLGYRGRHLWHAAVDVYGRPESTRPAEHLRQPV